MSVSLIGAPPTKPKIRITAVLGEAPYRNPNSLERTVAHTPGFNPYVPLAPASKTVTDLHQLSGEAFEVVKASMGGGYGWKILRLLPARDLEATLRYEHGATEPVLEHNGMRSYVTIGGGM